MYINDDLISNTLISRTHVFALLESAVVSIPVAISGQSYRLLKPGVVVTFHTEDPILTTLECTILDVESVKKPGGDVFSVRITIRSRNPKVR